MSELNSMGRKQARAYQLAEWVKGNPTHSRLSPHAECCPDFSCCGSELWPEDRRRAFVAADDQARIRMLFGGVASMLEAAACEVDKSG